MQTIRLALLTLSNSLEGQDATYTSCRLYDDSKLLEGPSKEEEIENTSRKLGLAKEVWHTLQSLFTSVAELMVRRVPKLLDFLTKQPCRHASTCYINNNSSNSYSMYRFQWENHSRRTLGLLE